VTTVAYDGKNIAVDTRIAGGFMHTSSKVQQLPDGSRGAGAGIVADIHRFFRSFFGDPATIPEGEYDTLVMHLDGRVVHYSGDGLAMDITGTRYAIGSGLRVACGDHQGPEGVSRGTVGVVTSVIPPYPLPWAA